MAEASGRAKLAGNLVNPPVAGVEFNDLPADRNDNLWNVIQNTYQLSLEELSALKNARCQGNDFIFLSHFLYLISSLFSIAPPVPPALPGIYFLLNCICRYIPFQAHYFFIYLYSKWLASLVYRKKF